MSSYTFFVDKNRLESLKMQRLWQEISKDCFCLCKDVMKQLEFYIGNREQLKVDGFCLAFDALVSFRWAINENHFAELAPALYGKCHVLSDWPSTMEASLPTGVQCSVIINSPFTPIRTGPVVNFGI